MSQPARFNDDLTAETYDRLLIPRVFRPWGALLLDRMELAPGDRVLDLATGPGTLARMAAERVGPSGTVDGADLSQPMLNQARSKPPVPGGAPLRYTLAPADALPFADGAFDALSCQQGLQFFPDQPKAVAEMRRVLRPGGRLGVASWAGPTAMTLMATFLGALDTARGRASNLPPLQWLDEGRMRGLFRDAGFRDVRVEEALLRLPFDSLAQAMACVEGTSAGQEVRALTPVQRGRYDSLVAAALEPYATAEGVSVPGRALIGLAHG